MEHFLIRTNEQKDPGLRVTNEIKDYLVKAGKKVSLEIMDSQRISEENSFKADRDNAPDLVIVLGGDGTLLRAARDYMEMEIPIFGVNLGTVGYLAEVDAKNVFSALDRIIEGDYYLENRMMLTGNLLKDNTSFETVYALNEISVLKSEPYQAIHIDIFVNGLFLCDYTADGIIVSTPTGSTGYNLSAGGPIVEPSADLIVMTPISPHTLNSRSVILSAFDDIKIVIKSDSNGNSQDATAMADGAVHFNMSTGDAFELKKSEKHTVILRLDRKSFLETLHRKLNA